MSDPALVSILIPTYNRSALISATVQSALSQTYPLIEVVVVDNASEDDTWQVLQELAREDRRVKIFRNPSNVGPVRNWIACAGQATGVFAKILWSDDLIHSDFLARCLPALDDPEVGFVYSSARIFKGDDVEEGRVVYQRAQGRHPIEAYIRPALLSGDVPFSPGCAIFRMADLRANLRAQVPNSIGSDFSRHAIGNDLLLFLLTCTAYRYFATVATPLAYFRDHSGSISTSSGSGRLVLHYDIVRAYFCHEHMQDRRLKTELNADLLWHRWRFCGAKHGIYSVSHFYPIPVVDTRPSLSRLVTLIAQSARQRVAGCMPYRSRTRQTCIQGEHDGSQ